MRHIESRTKAIRNIAESVPVGLVNVALTVQRYDVGFPLKDFMRSVDSIDPYQYQELDEHARQWFAACPRRERA